MSSTFTEKKSCPEAPRSSGTVPSGNRSKVPKLPLVPPEKASVSASLFASPPSWVVKLPPLVAEVEPGGANYDSRWTAQPRPAASAQGTHIPPVPAAGWTALSLTGKDEFKDVGICADKKKNTVKKRRVLKRSEGPLTATEVLQIYNQQTCSSCGYYFLKEVDGDSYRPYDLQVVEPGNTGPDYYMFTPDSVIHVTGDSSEEIGTPAEWHRESVLWTKLREIPYFKNFILMQTFRRWRENVRRIIFQRKCKNLQGQLVMAVPQFGKALLLFTRAIEELKGKHFLPQGKSESYTFLEFKDALKTMSQEGLEMLKRLSQFRSFVLNKVKEDCCTANRELQLHLECAERPNNGPIYLHVAHQRGLKKELAQSKSVMRKLGNFAAVVNQMTVQSLVTLYREDVMSFLSNVLKRQQSDRGVSFCTELCFDANNQLTVDPPVHQYQRVVSEALLTVGDTIIQMCDTCGFFLESNSDVSSSDFEHDLASDICFTQNPTTPENDQTWKFCCQYLRPGRVTSRRPELIKGDGVHGCYPPLSRRQLEWQISISDVSKHAEEEQSKIMQKAESEIVPLCESFSWLLDVRLFTSQWSKASLESLKGQPTVHYEELMKELHLWTEKIGTFPSSVSTSSDLFIIKCRGIKDSLGQQLRSVEEEVLKQLEEQIMLHSESLISDLEGAAAELTAEAIGIHDISKLADKVRESVKWSVDAQKRLEYIHSLQNILCINDRKMMEQEAALKEKVLAVWDRYDALLKQADHSVCHRLPIASHVLDRMFSSLVSDLKNTVSKATSGPFLDPTQNEKEMVFKLKLMCRHVHNLREEMQKMSSSSQNLQERPLDTTILTTHITQLEARKDLWELKDVSKTWMEEWKNLPFSEVSVSHGLEKITNWKEQTLSLTDAIPSQDAVLQETLEFLDDVISRLVLLAQLQRTTLKEKHWDAFFKGIGLHHDPEKTVMVAELMSRAHEIDQKLITKVCRAARAESNMEQTFLKLQQGWEEKLFQLDRLSLPVPHQCEPHHGSESEKPREDTDSSLVSTSQPSCDDVSRFIITGAELHLADIENDLMTLSAMMNSLHVVDSKTQMEEWTRSLQDLGKLLRLLIRYQHMWTFLAKMSHETPVCVQTDDLMEQFRPVDETFKEMMDAFSSDPHLLNLIHPKREKNSFHGDHLYQVLSDGLSTMEAISNQLTDQLDFHREHFPRLWFLSDSEVVRLLSIQPSPATMQSFVPKCFKGVRSLEVDREKPSRAENVQSSMATCRDHRQAKVLGIFGSLQEHISFLSPVEPNLSASSWLCVFEEQLKLCMKQLMQKCATARNQLEPSIQHLCDKTTGNKPSEFVMKRKSREAVLTLVSDYPLQCLLFVEEVVWCRSVQQASEESSPGKLRTLKERNSVKLGNLVCFIRNGVTGARSVTPLSRYMMTCLRGLVQLTMNHADQLCKLMEVQHSPLDSSFEWLSMMKYHLVSEDMTVKSNEDLRCFVDVLGHQFQYEYEYFGPEDLGMVYTPSTDRAILGILLALTTYRCGFLSGPRISGKNKTVSHLGKALGRQVVSIQCGPLMKPVVVERVLLGALQTGAWLLLDSVDLLKQGLLSTLGQHLEDIHQTFTVNPKVNEELRGRTADSGCPMVLAGKSLSARLSFGCVLISSNGHQSEVPESLRCATRPIALTHPDYRVIAEAQLTASGFSEATDLSRRLVTLINLAKDFNCLPDFMGVNQSCYLHILQRIIHASEIHLQQIIRQRGTSDEPTGLAAEHPDQTSAQDEKETVVEPNINEPGKPVRLRRSHLLVVRGLMEEEAIVKAVLSILLPLIVEEKKASQFNVIFKETLPLVCQFPFFQQYMEDEEKNQIKEAVSEEVQRLGFHFDTEMMHSALTLHRSTKVSQAVVLLGPPGSGKTTCLTALVGALNSLVSSARFVKDEQTGGDTPQAESRTSSLTWSSVDPVVLFPNTMSNEEVFGFFCERRGWQDGAVSRVLRDVGQREQTGQICTSDKPDHTPITTWLLMDGEPAGQPGWLDHLTTLCSPDDPFLFLPSCEVLRSHSHLKLLIETSDLRDASPSAVTRCSLVYFRGSDLWRAVWKSELDALSYKHKLGQETLKVWGRLSEDLFPRTLSFIRENSLSSAVQSKEGSLSTSTYGLQEITSFVRILRALLWSYGNEVVKAEANQQMGDKDNLIEESSAAGTDPDPKQSLLSRNLFLIAYIWGFGGHLHSCHWPQFDSLTRQVLYDCRYQIVVPDGESVFEHFFNTNRRMCHKNTLLTRDIPPKYDKHTLLLNLLLETNQPVLLAGEPGSGKTALCKTLLSFDKPHVSLQGSPLLSSGDLRTIISCINNEDTKQSMERKPKLLLFVDDLHEAPCDVFGRTSTVQETLRQMISTGGILTGDSYHFRLMSSSCIRYMATCCTFGSSISSRLSRLFSVLVLPGLGVDVIFSLHSRQLRIWLEKTPLKRSLEDAAHSIIAATTNLLDAVCEQFPPTSHRPHFMFSHHDLQKVFSGMCLWRPENPTLMQGKEEPPPNIAHLWMHECMRTFGDRLCTEDERKTLVSLISQTATAHYEISLDGKNTVEGPSPHTLPAETHPLQPENAISKLVYGPALSEARKFVNQTYQDQNVEVLQEELQKLGALMDREEEKGDDSITTRVLVHRQNVSQLLHILRGLLIPAGHGLLISSERGTGRKTAVRLAASLMGYRLMEVHPGNENNLHKILKEAENQTREEGVNVVILVHEGIQPSVREELLAAMTCGAYPGRHTEEELRDLASRMTAVKNSRRYLMDCWKFQRTLDQIHKHVHVFLLLPSSMWGSSETPSNKETQRWKAQLTRALSRCCCVEVYQPWSSQSLVEAAAQCLKDQMDRDGSEVSLSVVMAGIHQSACQYASVFLAAQPFSPQTYIQFIAHFGHLFEHLRKQISTNSKSKVLSQLDVMKKTALEFKQKMLGVQRQLAATQQRMEKLLGVIGYQKRRLEEAEETIAQKEKEMEEELEELEERINAVFTPALKSLSYLNPSDLEEVRHYRDPPDGVVKIMDAICLLFARPPGWETAKQLLGQPNFFQELEFFDRYSLTDEQLQQLGEIVHSPQFVPESVREVSRACESLCRWVTAVYGGYRAQRDLREFKRETHLHLNPARQQKAEAERCLKDAEHQLQFVVKESEEQIVDLRAAQRSVEEADRATLLLETNVSEWRNAAQLEEEPTLLGDALILAAVISYLGPFAPDMRAELLSKWRELCQTGSIKINPKDPRASLFTHSDSEPLHPLPGFPIPVSQRTQLPVSRALGIHEDVPLDRMIVKLLLWGCMRTWVQHWPLLVDVQQHLDISAQRWLVLGDSSTLDAETQCGMVVRADDPELLSKLNQAAVEGFRVLVTHVERAVPGPLFLSRLTRHAGCCSPGSKQHIQKTHPDFSLILSTDLPAQMLSNAIHPSILAQVGVVDLSLSSEEIQELMLTQLLQSECKELLSLHSRILNDKQLLHEKLVSKEDYLIDFILQNNILLLKDSDSLSVVAACQTEMKKLQSEVQQLSDTLEDQESLLVVPRQLMRLAADLFQALQGVSRLSPAYHFPLQSFSAVMQEAFVIEGRPIVPYRTANVPKEVIAEVTNRMVHQLLLQYRPLLFKNHAAVLKLLVSVTLLQHDQLCSEAERAAFTRGLQDMRHTLTVVPPSTSSSSTSALPGWIPPHTHQELLHLEQVSGFEGLIASLSSNSAQWQEYLLSPSSILAEPVLCPSHSHLSLLQRALLFKTVIPNCLEGLAETVAAYYPFLLGQRRRSEAPHVRNPEALLQFLSKHEGPIILTLPSQRGETWTSVRALPLIKRLALCAAQANEIQLKVVSLEALCDRDLILSALDRAVADGHWLVFNGCHLMERWDREVVARLSLSVSASREERSLSHPGFRLWFITQEYAFCSIPASVRTLALPLVCDPPWDLAQELSSSFREVSSIIPSKIPPGVTADKKEVLLLLLLRCAIFHSVLLQRQAYKYLGQGGRYTWNQSDLQALMDAHSSISSLCHDEDKALRYTAVNLVHGGHVLDSGDLNMLEGIAETCLGRSPPLLGSGPHVLVDILTNTGNFDFSGLQRIVEQDSADINDPLTLGFSGEDAAEIRTINNHHLNILLQASQTPLGAVRSLCPRPNQSASIPAYSQTRDRLRALKSNLLLKKDGTDSDAEAVSLGPLRDFLQAEWDELIDRVSLLLSQLQHPIQSRTPAFTLLLELTDLSRLERRAELLRAYLSHFNTSDPPAAYRLSAFRNARGFLPAVMREAARLYRKNISDITLKFQVLSDSPSLASLPAGAVCLCGLQLRGALWDSQLGGVQDTLSSQPCALPCVCVEAAVRSRNSTQTNLSCESVPVRGAQVTQTVPLYHCPLYLDQNQESGNRGLADINIITTVPLHVRLSPVLCSLRRVRLVSMLS